MHQPFRLLIVIALGLIGLLAPAPRAFAGPPVEQSIQAFLDAQPGPLKTYRDGEHTAAEWIQAVSAYYGLSPRILLALLEATNGLISRSAVGDDVLQKPFGSAGPTGFGNQIDWAGRELRAGLGPYVRPPTVRFTDGTTLTLTLEQAPEGVAVQRFLAKGRTQVEWRAAVDRFGRAFQIYFNNELPDLRSQQPAATTGFLHRPWAAGTEVTHLAYFDHVFPTVDTGEGDNGFVVNYLGRGNVQYDGHDGHDFYFPRQPIGTYIYAAADGVAYARTHRGNGVVIVHPGGYETVYWHLDAFAGIFRGKIDTDQGVAVHAGDLIGSSGKSGFTNGTPHLHFEVRHNGHLVDPYGWFGPGTDPCAAYGGCEASSWLWHASLAGEFDFTLPEAAPPDTTPPVATLSVNPPDDLLFLARFDDTPLQHIGIGTPTVAGTPAFAAAKFGQGVRISTDQRLAYPVNGNLNLDAGTIAFWAQLPETYPATGTARNYLLAASAHPDDGPVYTGTLALRRDRLSPHQTPRWNFWTTPDSGEAGRNDLAVPDTLAPGLHHFAISWDRATGSKALYLDGVLAASVIGVELPTNVGPMLEMGCFLQGYGYSGVAFDELAIFGRALPAAEVAALATAQTPLRAGIIPVASPDLLLDINAMDDGGGIASVQTGVDGVFNDPQPFYESYHLSIPSNVSSGGLHTVAARLFDWTGNEATVTATVRLAQPSQPALELEDVTDLGLTLAFSPTDEAPGIEVQVSATADFAGAVWQPLPERLAWLWVPGRPRVVWVRFRTVDGLISAPLLLGPDVRHAYLPAIGRL